MSVPDWRKSTAGTRVRVALWLVSEVGLGGAFTKAQLRHAFPSVEQVDRRMRDLRADGWIITTYREDRSLSPDELRLGEIGGRVWERGYRRNSNALVTDKERKAILAADNYCCVYCGVGGGEPYPDDAVRTAKLAIARIASVPNKTLQLHTVCDRCLPAVTDGAHDPGLLSAIQDLDIDQLDQLRTWVQGDRRPRTQAEQLWARYRRLPHAARLEIRSFLSER